MDMNLLPKEKTLGKKAQKSALILNRIAIGACLLFLVLVILGGAIYYLMNQKVEKLKVENNTYTANIQSLSSTESNLIFLRDRIQKAQSILGTRTIEDSFNKQNSIISFDTEAIVFERSEVDASRSNIELNSANSRDLSQLVSHIIGQQNFVSLVLGEMTYNQTTGYTVTFEGN